MRISLALAIALLVAACAPSTPSSAPSSPVDATATPSSAPSSPVDATATPALAIATPVAPTPTASPEPTAAPTPTPTVTPPPTASPEPTAAPTPTPAPWASYKSKRYRYVIKYPATWVVTPGKAGLADQFDGYRYPYFFVNRSTVTGIASVSLTVTSDKAYFKSHYKAKVVSNKPVKLHGYSGRLVTYRGVSDGVKLLFQELVLAKGHVFYRLEAWGYLDAAAADRALFNKFYKTWRPT